MNFSPDYKVCNRFTNPRLQSLTSQDPSKILSTRPSAMTSKTAIHLSTKSSNIINIHHQSLNQKHTKHTSFMPSIVSSVLYLQKKSRDTIKPEIFNFQGGGFKGVIQKTKRIRSLLPTFRIEIINPPTRKHNQSQKLIKLKPKPISIHKTMSTVGFADSVLGCKLSITSNDDNPDLKFP